MRAVASLFGLVVSFMLFAPCFAYSPPPVTDGLVGCWDFDEGSSITAMDMSGNENDGTMVNTTYSEPPPGSLSNASLSFNTTQAGYAYSYVTIPDSPSLRPSSGLTLAAWIKADTIEQRSCVIISKQYSTYSSYRDSFALLYGGGSVSFVLDSGTNYRGISTAKPSANEWHHIVGTYNGSSMRLYVDGVERVHDTFTGALAYNGNPVLIGAACDNGNHTPDQGWNGLIDEVLIYNRSLSQAEIMQIIPEFPSALALSLFTSAATVWVIMYTRRSRKHDSFSFS